MTEPLCSCCKLFGKPPARINFIVATGLPYSVIYEQTKYLLENYSDVSALKDDTRLTNYGTLIDISDHIFNSPNGSSTVEQSTLKVTEKCCHGFGTILVLGDDKSDADKIEILHEDIRHLLESTADSATVGQVPKFQKPSWVMISHPVCLEPALLDVFLQLHGENSSLLRFTLTILCFLGTEQVLFKNWFVNDLPLKDYESNTYPEHERRIKKFFSFLNTSEYLQKNTVLLNEEELSAKGSLEKLLQGIFGIGSSKYRACNKEHRSTMTKLLVYRRRQTYDMRTIRQSLLKSYHTTLKLRLEPLYNDLKQTTTATAANAARQICHIVLDEFERLNNEERRVYKRLLMLGFKQDDATYSKTITAQLVFYALHLLQKENDISIPLLFSIVLVICKLGSHFLFRHHLFSNTPEIYTLSLLLITQRRYPLTLSGLRLCTTILKGDQVEHKYALAYWKHDASTARKILDAVRWLLSPYLTLKTLWQEEDEKENDDTESDEEQSSLYTAQEFCSRHTDILIERSYLLNIALLFYGSTDHNAQVTEDDIHNFAEVIAVLTDRRMIGWRSHDAKFYFSPMLVSHICELLTPILLFGSPSVNLVLRDKNDLLTNIPQVIPFLLRANRVDETMINTCVRFYTQLVHLRYKAVKLDDDSEEEGEPAKLPDATTTTEKSIDPPAILDLSKDLITSYFDLYRQIRRKSLVDDQSAQQEQIHGLLNEEWKKLDTIRLKHEHDQLKYENQSLKHELLQLRDELQSTQAEKDQFRKECMQLAHEIDNLKRVSVTSAITITEPQPSSNLVSINSNNQNNVIDDLKDLLPYEITPVQAEQCIGEIYRRRTTFNELDMRKSVCGSLKHLGSDLYSSPVHFLHELIQNAEDNFYATETPRLRIELDHNYILLSNNERGLRTEDVLAICSLAVSTKTDQQEQLGEKGVGFKSVFAASNEPTLISRAWRFRFQVPGSDAMSYITPLWLTEQEIPECISNQIPEYSEDTHLYLPLKLQPRSPEAESFLNQVSMAVDPCILLNMRHLNQLQIVDKRENKETLITKHLEGPAKLVEQAKVEFEGFSFNKLTGSIVKLCVSSSSNTFRLYTCHIDVPESIEQRRSPTARLIIAFPCDNDYRLTSTVYTGLPVCDLGVEFLFNADFKLVTNRENVRENVQFNRYLRDHLAALFVYLLLNDSDLKKDISRYCPSKNMHQLKHLSWWSHMITDINKLITTYLSDLLGISAGKTIRYLNADLAALISNEQLDDNADIKVIDSDSSFWTAERLKSFQVQSVSIVDVLRCFPDREETSNESRHHFRLWAEKQDKRWWTQLFHHIGQGMTSEVSNIMLLKPIFLLTNDHQRQYLPPCDTGRLHLFVSDDQAFQMWKRQITLLQHISESEKTALLKSNHIQLLDEERLIDIISKDHVQLAAVSLSHKVDLKRIEEIWRDLFYLKSRVERLKKSTPYLVPVQGTSNLTVIQNTTLPTIFGMDIRSFMHPTNSSIIHIPYYNVQHHQLHEILQWEYFLLEMGCQRPKIHLPSNYTLNDLPLLPSFTTFTDKNSARMGQSILSRQEDSTKDCLRQFPIVDGSKDQHISPVSATFDATIVHDLPSLPRIVIPPHCRGLANNLGVCVEYDLRTCVTILQLLSTEKNTDVDLYIQWLGRLQLYLRQQQDQFDPNSLLSSCQLYLPDQRQFYPLTDLLVTSDNENRHTVILLVSKYLKRQWISPTVNQIYWQFKDLFRLLGCTCAINIDHVYNTIYAANGDKSNFYSFGDCNTMLTENGMETMIVLFEYLEDLILKCVKENAENSDLYRAVVDNKHPTAFSGSPDDLQWRFGFTCNSLSKELAKLTKIQSQKKKIGLPTIDQRLVTKTSENIVYACFEGLIARNLAKAFGKRNFILSLVTRTCPLVLAIFEIDYVERRGKLEWRHKNNNMEFQLTQLTDIFREVVNDNQLEAITSKFASVTLLLSDSFVIDSGIKQNANEIDRCELDTDSPFWIFNKTILFCAGFEVKDATKAIIATSALTTLLHKRKHVPLDEAKSIAREQISTCREFNSRALAHVAGTEANIYSYTDVLFPTDHHSFESMIISIGNGCTTEQDLQDDRTITEIAMDRVTEDRKAVDELYRSRVETQDHTSGNEDRTKTWTNPPIIDHDEEIRIGQNAEHFFFDYLQKHYGIKDVTPTNNWPSKSRLAIYPQCQRKINDAAGYDLELHDTREVFVRGTNSRTKKCYFEVKGTKGSYSEEHTRFHVSQNEYRTCEAISLDETRKDESYFIVIIANCLDPEKICLGTVINWSANMNRLLGAVDSYQCRIIPLSLTDSQDLSGEEIPDYNKRQPQLQSYQPANSSNRDQRRFQPRQSGNPQSRHNGLRVQYAATNDGYPASAHYSSPHYHDQQYQQPMNTNYRNDYYETEPLPTNRSYQAPTPFNQPPHRNQQPRGQRFHQNRRQQQ